MKQLLFESPDFDPPKIACSSDNNNKQNQNDDKSSEENYENSKQDCFPFE